MATYFEIGICARNRKFWNSNDFQIQRKFGNKRCQSENRWIEFINVFQNLEPVFLILILQSYNYSCIAWINKVHARFCIASSVPSIVFRQTRPFDCLLVTSSTWKGNRVEDFKYTCSSFLSERREGTHNNRSSSQYERAFLTD